MQAAATRSAGVQRLRRTDRLNATPHLAVVDDMGLLDALPIAAAIIERADEDSLRVSAHNSRFVETVQRSNCTALDWNEAECLRAGPIADLLRNFFDGKNQAGELDTDRVEPLA